MATKIAEGTTKIIWREEIVLVESKDDITAGDGARRHVIESKGHYANRTTVKCFQLLAKHGIATHFVDGYNPWTFRARRCDMIPIEVVTRRVASGSYLKRYPLVAEGMRFNAPVVEFFFKDDARHDPLMRFDDAVGGWLLYDAKKPANEGLLDGCMDPGRFFVGAHPIGKFIAGTMTRVAMNVFAILESAWAKQDVTLVDLKIEFGFDVKTGGLLVADAIDNDSWRIWPGGDKSQARDQQAYRDLAVVTPEDLKTVRDNYAWVADATMKFLR
jgi:phosphoribosylaminoimidazole-succinocarboxamide synthase